MGRRRARPAARELLLGVLLLVGLWVRACDGTQLRERRWTAASRQVECLPDNGAQCSCKIFSGRVGGCVDLVSGDFCRVRDCQPKYECSCDEPTEICTIRYIASPILRFVEADLDGDGTARCVEEVQTKRVLTPAQDLPGLPLRCGERSVKPTFSCDPSDADATFTGDGNGLFWSDPNNWSSGSVPNAFDVVAIDAGVVGGAGVIIDTSAQVSDLCSSAVLTLAAFGSLRVLGTARVGDLEIEAEDRTTGAVACRLYEGTFVVHGAVNADDLAICRGANVEVLHAANILSDLAFRGGSRLLVAEGGILTTGNSSLTGGARHRITNEGTHCVQNGITSLSTRWLQDARFGLLDLQYGQFLVGDSAVWLPSEAAGLRSGAFFGDANSAFIASIDQITLAAVDTRVNSDAVIGVTGRSSALTLSLGTINALQIEATGTVILQNEASLSLDGYTIVRLVEDADGTLISDLPVRIQSAVVTADLSLQGPGAFTIDGPLTVSPSLQVTGTTATMASLVMEADAVLQVSSDGMATIGRGSSLQSSVVLSGLLSSEGSVEIVGPCLVVGGTWQIAGTVSIANELSLNNVNLVFSAEASLVIAARLEIQSGVLVTGSGSGRSTALDGGLLVLNPGSTGNLDLPGGSALDLSVLAEMPVLVLTGSVRLSGQERYLSVGLEGFSELTLVDALEVVQMAAQVSGVLTFEGTASVEVLTDLTVQGAEFYANLESLPGADPATVFFRAAMELEGTGAFVHVGGTAAVSIGSLQGNRFEGTQMSFETVTAVGRLVPSASVQIGEGASLAVADLGVFHAEDVRTDVYIDGDGESTLTIMDKLTVNLPDANFVLGQLVFTTLTAQTELNLLSGVFRVGYGQVARPTWDVRQGIIRATVEATIVAVVSIDMTEEFAPNLDVSGLDGTLNFICRAGFHAFDRLESINSLTVNGCAVSIDVPIVETLAGLSGQLTVRQACRISSGVNLNGDSTIVAAFGLTVRGRLFCNGFRLTVIGRVFFGGGVDGDCYEPDRPTAQRIS